MEILGDRKFVEVPGSRTHELPPLLVRCAPEGSRIADVSGSAIFIEVGASSTPSKGVQRDFS